MLGTTFRLGFDGSAVNRGLGGIGSAITRSMRQVGIGIGRSIGYSITGAVMRSIKALPASMLSIANFGSEISDLEVQTKIGSRALLELREAMIMAGAAPRDFGRTLSEFSRVLKDVSLGRNKEAQEQLKELGFTAQELAKIPLDEAFHKFGKAVFESQGDVKNLEGTMSTFFGGARGSKMLRFFADYEANMAKMRQSMVGFDGLDADFFDGADDLADAALRFQTLKYQLSATILQGLGGGGSMAGDLHRLMDSVVGYFPRIEAFFSRIRSEIGMALEPGTDGTHLSQLVIGGITNAFKSTVGSLASTLAGALGAELGAMSDIFIEIGKSIGRGAAGAISEAFGGTRFGKIMGIGSSANSTASVDDSVARDQLRVLHRIERNVGIAKFA